MSSTAPNIQKLAQESGNTFHYKVVNFLRTRGWFVLVSPYYMDGFTDKPREIDILAEKEFYTKKFIGGNTVTVCVRFLIECKYLKNETVFWFDEKNKEESISRAMLETGLKHPSENTTIEKHHYIEDVPVAKVFTSSKSQNGSSENEPFYKGNYPKS